MYAHFLEVRPVDDLGREMLDVTRQMDDVLLFTLPNAVVPGDYELTFFVQNHASVPLTDCDIDARMSFNTYLSQPITIVP